MASEETRRLICGIPVDDTPHEQVLAAIDSNVRGERRREHICITNTESMYYARRVAAHRRYIETSRFSLCDGMGVVIVSRLQRRPVRRFNGPALMLECARYGASRGWRHFFCGGKEGVADQLSARLTAQFPGLITAGTYCPPFRELAPADESAMIETINAARPDILWVGLGLLKQEAFIERYARHLDVPWSVGVGAAFDYHAGTARWAPEPIRKAGFEWLYRLVFEPRMLVRNGRSFVFLAEGLIEAVFGAAPILGGRS